MKEKAILKLLGLVYLGIMLWLFVDGFVIGNTASQIKFLEMVIITSFVGYGVHRVVTALMVKFNRWLRETEQYVQTISAEVRTTSQTVSADINRNLIELKQIVALIALIVQVLSSIFQPAQRPPGTYRK